MRDLPLGNGSLLVNFDDKYQIRDVYFPHVGQENHSDGYPFRLGVWVDGVFSWTFEDAWQRDLRYTPDALITNVRLRHERLGIEIVCRDMVAGRENVFLRHLLIKDLSGTAREVRVFLHHDFRIYENKVGDTAYYDPDTRSLIHYKKHRYFLINTYPHFNEFATGRKDFRHHEGTWRDAEDGHLHGGAITEGSVDSTIAVHGLVPAHGEFAFDYWIAAGTSHHQVSRINRAILDKGPSQYFSKAALRGRDWLAKSKIHLDPVPDEVAKLYRRSLLIARTQVDNDGAIIAATDHDVIERATDHYSYMWPRDGAFIANAFDRAGYPEVSRRFFTLCHKIVDERGYFLQKYNPDGSIGSGWHAFWDTRNQREQLPIQQDETALVLWALGEHCDIYRDDDYVRSIYPYLIAKCADFLVEYRDPSTGLPRPSWNLWEDRRGIHTFTCSTVVAGLRAAAGLAQISADSQSAARYITAAEEVVLALREHLFDAAHNRFLRGLLVDHDDRLVPDATVDASLFGLFYFGCFSPDDPIVVSTMRAVEDRLYVDGVEGLARFEHDGYMRVSEDVPGNPWVICTLWLAEYYIAAAKTEADLGPAMELLEWVVRMALPSGVLPEQVHPKTGEGLSVSPLTWSQSTFVAAVDSYVTKLGRLQTVENATTADI